MRDASVDLLTANGGGGMSGSGSIAMRLLQSGFDIDALRPCVDAGNFRGNATLRQREWIEYDTAIVEVARRRLVGVADLMNAGLRYPIANALGVTRVEWENVGDMTDASVTMSGISESENDRVDFSLIGMPLPIIHKDFNINVRALEASRKTGQALDMTQAQLAARIVAEKLETILFLGWTGLGTNNPIYGYLTALNRNTGSVTATWTTATGNQMVTDTLAMINKAVSANMYGPYQMYVPQAVFVHMGDDFKTNSDLTIMQRLLQIPGISGIKMSKDLTSSQILLIQMTPDVVDMIDGIQPTTIQWDTHAGFVVHFKVMTIMIPRVRTGDYAAQSGIVHYS